LELKINTKYHFLTCASNNKTAILTIAFLSFLAFQGLFAQIGFELKVTGDSLLASKYTNRKFSNKSELIQVIEKEYRESLLDGYFNAVFDTLMSDSTLFLSIQKGKLFEVHIHDPSGDLKNKTKDRGPKLLEKAEERLEILENNGYPFAYIDYTNKFSLYHLELSLIETPGPLYTFDSLVVKGDGKVPERYIRKFLNYKKGKLYDESWIRATEKRLNEIPFLRTLRATEVLFKQNKADTYVYLTKKNANYFNGIIGIQPNESTGKTNITGDLELRLFNLLNSGDEVFLNWRKLQPQTQDLKIRLMIPFIAGLPIGTEGKLNIFRRDTSFTNFRTSLALVHIIGGYNRIKIFVEKTATNQLNKISTSSNLANINATLYGLGFHYEVLDYRYNPRKGFESNAEIAAGTKTTESQAPENFGSGQYNQYRAEATLNLYIPTWKRQTIHVGLISGTLISPYIFTTEMYRIGGLNTLRGLDEESLFASSFFRSSLEYRYLLDRNSHVYLFADQGWYERKDPDNTIEDTPLGFGAGVSFETKAGIFLFNYALGQEFDNPILVRNGKISFGFRNVF
jgi:outer membrane protein assembly factor BamA